MCIRDRCTTRPSITGAQGWQRTFATRDSTLNIYLTPLLFMLNFKHTDFSVTVTFVTSLGVNSDIFVRRSVWDAWVMKHVQLSNITFSHLIVINIIDINIGVNFLNHSIASVRKELRLYMNALTTSHCHLSAKYECRVSKRSASKLFRCCLLYTSDAADE